MKRMIHITKTKTIETVEEFDKDGNLIRKTTTERTEEDNSVPQYYPWWHEAPWNNPIVYHPSYGTEITCNTSADHTK